MAAIITPPTSKLLQKLQTRFPDIAFRQGDDFAWSARSQTILYAESESSDLLLLHEVAHFLCSHEDFSFDIELLKQEREAWDLVRRQLAKQFEISLDEELIENALDTYREWLHGRSLCPQCGLTGLQTKTSTYVCANCRCSWRPNDARRCALRRYIT